MTKKTFSSIKSGDQVDVGYRSSFTLCTFLGFTDNKTKYSQTPVYSNADAMLKAVGVTTFPALEKFQDEAGLPYGHHFYAVFKDNTNGDIFSAYLFKGRWCLGTSADLAQLR